jgi:hypothetical protein
VTDDLFAAPIVGPVASFACECGARDEVKEPAPPTVDCFGCRQVQGMKRFSPRWPPPRHAGRTATARELARVV